MARRLPGLLAEQLRARLLLVLFDDMDNRDIMVGYVFEYEVPEPGTLLLFGAGLLGLGISRRKRTV